LDADNVDALLSTYDLILDCTDMVSTRLLLNDAAVRLQKPIIQAGIYQYEGQIHLMAPGTGGCLRCQWPELPEANEPGACLQHGVLGAVPGLFGTLQAMEAVKWLVGLPTPLQDHVLILNVLNYQQHLIRRTPQADCPACGQAGGQSLDQRLIEARRTDAPSEEPDSVWELVFQGTPLKLTQFTLIDVNEAREHRPIPDLVVQNIPFSRFELDHPPPLDKETHYLLYCAKGVRSAHLVRELRKRGYTNVFALAGGQAQQNLTALRKQELEEVSLFYVRH
jgi:adenylyltransferase/sulfurtransferase